MGFTYIVTDLRWVFNDIVTDIDTSYFIEIGFTDIVSFFSCASTLY